jgi:transposase
VTHQPPWWNTVGMFLTRVLFLVVMATARIGATRDFDAMERRRKRAAELFRQGKTQADVVRELDVSRQSVSRWHADWKAGGATALRGAGRAGRLPLLDAADLKRVARQLEKGPLANGYATDMWTLSRVGEVIEAETGVAYHQSHVWRILRQMGWSRQRPARRAVERDDQAIARWVKEDWPRVKKTPAAEGPGSAFRTRAGSASSPR